MLSKPISGLQLWILLLSLYFIILQAFAANISTQKNQQQTQAQPSPVQQQQQSHPSVHQQVAQQQHHQQQQQQVHLQQAQHLQYVQEKDPMHDIIKHVSNEEDLSDTYQFLNELKHDLPPPLPAQVFPWNPFNLFQHNTPPQIPPTNINNQQSYSPFEGVPSFTAAPHTPKYLPFISYPQPVFIPYPFYIAPPEMFYSTFPGGGSSSSSGTTTTTTTSANGIDDTMSRAATGRRPSTSSPPNGAYSRNSPIYYVRLPPVPYMFLPGLGYTSPSPATAFSTGLTSILPYQTHTLPTFSPFSPIFNVPMNFVANGKPSNIYQMGGSPNDIQSSLQFIDANGFNSRAPPPPPPLQSVSNPYRPMSSPSYMPHSSYGISAPPPPSPYQDSKMTTLKRPFVFNGRPEDIFILPNNFNPLYADSGYY